MECPVSDQPDDAPGGSGSPPPEADATAWAKERWRRTLLAARARVPREVREAADAALLRTLGDLVQRSRASVVAAYVPMGSEPGGPQLPAALAAAGVRLLLPVVRDDLDLDWAAYQGPDSLRPTRLGPREPVSPRLGVAAVAGADLVVVPALAVDATGVRLGRGGGSYDRALARVPASALVIALLYDGELVDRLPAEPHDRRVDAVIMPGSGVVFLPTSAGRAAGG